MSASELHQIGLDGVEGVLKQVDKILEKKVTVKNLVYVQISELLQGKAFKDKSPSQMIETFKQDTNQQYGTKDEILEDLQTFISISTDFLQDFITQECLSNDIYKLNFEVLPRGRHLQPFDYVRVPITHKENGTIQINLDLIGELRKFEIPALAMNYGNPGRHLEESVFRQVFSGNPEFYSAPPFGEYSTVPAATPTYSAFGEGWAAYSEEVAIETILPENTAYKFGTLYRKLIR